MEKNKLKVWLKRFFWREKRLEELRRKRVIIVRRDHGRRNRESN